MTKASKAEIMTFRKVTRMVQLQKNNIINNGLYSIEPLSFNNFKQREVLKVLLQKKNIFRNKKELLYIKKFFSSFKMFKDMGNFLTNQLMLSLCRELMYLQKNKNDVIFYEGDIGKKFYIIIDGEVEVLEEKVKKNNSGMAVNLRADITKK